jgi:hypothetical protein
MARVGPGSPFPGPFGVADIANSVLESADEYRLQRRLGKGGGGNVGHLGTDLVKVKNGTGTLLRAGEIVEFDTHALTTLDRQAPWFTAEVPDETRAFAVLLEGIANDANAIGLAQISGRCPALINVGATTDLWAYVSSGADVLVGDRFWGDVRLLFTPPGTGEQLLWVNIEKSPQEWLGKTDASHAKGATGTVSVWSGTPGSETDTTFNITSVYNRGISAGSGKWVGVARLHRKPYLTWIECPVA